MENRLLDQYTYLHFAVGIIVYFWGLSFTSWFIIHSLYEYIEITQLGTYIINKYFSFIWPGGGKHKAETFFYNGFGDTTGAIIGWLSAYYLDKIGNKYQWYKKHIN